MHWNRTFLRSFMWTLKRFELFLKVVALSKSIYWNEGISFTSSTFSRLMFLFDIRFSFVRCVRFRVRMDWDIMYWTQESEIRLRSHAKSAQPCLITGAWERGQIGNVSHRNVLAFFLLFKDTDVCGWRNFGLEMGAELVAEIFITYTVLFYRCMIYFSVCGDGYKLSWISLAGYCNLKTQWNTGFHKTN